MILKINNAFKLASKKQLNKILEITNEKLVSIDFNHNSASAIIDTSLTNVVGKNMGKISAWYDNEWGFSNRMCDIVENINKIFLMKSIKDETNLNKKRILLRLDLNVPLKNGKINDSTRIDKILPTLKFLLKQNSKIIILSHVGRPNGKFVNDLSLQPICEDLQNKLNVNVKLITNNIKEIKDKRFF